MATVNDEAFRNRLQKLFETAEGLGRKHFDVTSRELLRDVCAGPGAIQHMPNCCDAMRQEMQSGDEILEEADKGRAVLLRIRYRIPRPS